MKSTKFKRDYNEETNKVHSYIATQFQYVSYISKATFTLKELMLNSDFFWTPILSAWPFILPINVSSIRPQS